MTAPGANVNTQPPFGKPKAQGTLRHRAFDVIEGGRRNPRISEIIDTVLVVLIVLNIAAC